jgi:hypothetical protein
MRLRAIGIAAVLVAFFSVCSCGLQGGGAIARQFGRAQSIKIVDNKTGREIATVRLTQDLQALADGLARGEVKAREQRAAAFTLVLVFPDGSKGRAYVDVDYRAGPGQARRGWVQYEGIGHVYPRALFWDVFDKYVLPALPASRKARA